MGRNCGSSGNSFEVLEKGEPVFQQLRIPGVAKPLALVCLASAVLAHVCAERPSLLFPCCALLGRSKGSRSVDIPRAGL